MGHDDQACASAAQRLKTGQHAPDTRIVANNTICKRNIQIQPHKTPFACGFNVVNEQKRGIHHGASLCCQ
jgi:hypothetical protein